MQKRVPRGPSKCGSAGAAVAYCKATCNTAVLESVDQRTIKASFRTARRPPRGARPDLRRVRDNRPRPVQFVCDAPKYVKMWICLKNYPKTLYFMRFRRKYRKGTKKQRRKRPKVRKWSPKVSKSEPKRAKREPKGAKGRPK